MRFAYSGGPVFLQNRFPASLRRHQEFDHFADRAFAATRVGDVVRGGFDFVAGIGGRKGQARAAKEREIRQIIACVGDLAWTKTALRDDFLEDRDFFNVALIDVGHADLFGSLGCGGGITAADHAGLDIVPGEPLQSDAILGMEAFGFGDLARAERDVEDLAVGEDAVDIH